MTTFADLKAAVSDWFVAGNQPDSIYQLAREDINRDLRVEEMVAYFTGTASANVNVPTDFIAFKSLYVNRDDRTPIVGVAGFSIDNHYQSSGLPREYTRVGQVIRLNPVPDSAYDLAGFYYAEEPVFSANTDTSDTLAAHLNVYLAACLRHAFAWDQDAERQGYWEAEYEKRVMKANRQAAMDGFHAPMVSRPEACA